MSEEPTSYNKFEIAKKIGLDKDDFKMEQIFGVFKQVGSKHFYFNILNTVTFPSHIRASSFDAYFTRPNDTWTLISYKHYNRIDLWWLVAAYNQIDDTFTPLPPGTRLKVPTPDTIRAIIDKIKNLI